jgi:PepSY-associated TM region
VSWKRVDYLVHRWIGIGLGLLVLVWFVSGIVMIYYPWPMPTESEEFARLHAFTLPANVIGYDSAANVARRYLVNERAGPQAVAPAIVGARLMEWDGHLVYSVWRQYKYSNQPTVLVDALTARLLSPISRSDAVLAARRVVGPLPVVKRIDLLASGDHYLLSSEYQVGFPAYSVEFDDVANTTVYVSREAGYVVGIVTNLTRWTTWLGTVPHWLYFKWLYSRHISWWLWISYILPAIAMIAGGTGVVLGLHQLFPRRRRGEWRMSAYRGVSKWHHLSGVLFGILVITWSFSGILEVLGPDGTPTDQQVSRARGIDTTIARLTQADALSRLRASSPAFMSIAPLPVAIDFTHLSGRPGYVIHLEGQREYWVDGTSGVVRSQLDADEVRRIAVDALGTDAPVSAVELITKYDTYYYARPHREWTLPTWRVAFSDPAHSTVYVEPVSGKPTGFVDSETRWYRWLRDGLHSLDFPAINGKRPLWDIVLLPLMLGGTVAAVTGVWLLIRRLARLNR